MTEDVIFSKRNQLGLITLNRPQALNALTLDMIKAIQKQLLSWQDDSEVAAVLVLASPGKAFCAGGDIRWLYDAGRNDNPEQMDFFEHEYRLNHFIHHYPKPYISFMDGMTMGGGVGISMHGSHPVASERFVFAMPETGIGFFPDIGASFLLSRCPGALGMYLGLTGQRLGAEEALNAGLCKYLIDSEQIPVVVDELATLDLSQQGQSQIDACLKSFASHERERLHYPHQQEVDRCFSKKDLSEVMMALEQSEDPWARQMHENLLSKSPLSLRVTFEQIHRAKYLSLDACLKMDFVLVEHFMKDHDFYEGVRALLVDKDKSPQWRPKTLAEVSSSRVAEYFELRRDELIFINSF